MAVTAAAPPIVWPGGGDWAVSRRAWLRRGARAAAGGVLLLGGCATQARPAAPPLTVAIVPKDLLTRVPGLLASYERANPSVRLLGGTASAQTGPYQIATGFGDISAAGGAGFSMVALDAALRSLNFNERRLLAGSVASFTVGSQVFGLPYVVMPWSVTYRQDAFAAAGLPPPAARWTLDDFEQACAALMGAIQAGKAPSGVRWVLPVAAGSRRTKYGSVQGFLNNPAFAAAFAAGYGAPLYGGGRFRLTAPAAVEALGRLVSLCRQYAAPSSTLVVGSPGQPAPPIDAAVRWGFAVLPGWPLDPQPAAGAGPWRNARFPVLPEVPVVPVTYQGILVTQTGVHRAAGGDATDPHVEAAVRFAVWLYGADPQRALMAASLPPVVRDARTQEAFWAAQPLGFADVGDWRGFTDVMAAWPVADTTLITAAVQAEVAEPGSLVARLTTAEQQLNHQLGRPAAQG